MSEKQDWDRLVESIKEGGWYTEGTRTGEVLDRAMLSGILRELAAIRKILECPRFLNIPSKLDAIKKNTAKPKKRKARKA